MKNKKCKFCQSEIDNKAKVCPNCKKDLRNWFAKHPIITVILILLVVGMMGSSGSSTSSTNNSSQNNNSNNTKNENKKQENIAKINEDLTLGEVKWKVVKAWKADVLYDYMNAVKPAGKFIIVNVTVENMGKEMKTVTGLKVVDDKGREFTAYSKTFGLKNLGADSLYILSNINPNVPLTFADVYEVPADATGLKLKVGDLTFTGKSTGMIDLGL